MKRDKSFGANFSRRTLMTSAMAGAFTVAAHPAAAQRCPPIPPARVKGPLVWMNMDQQDVDEAYDNDVYAFNSKNVLERQAANNEIARLVVGKPMRVPYGPTEIEHVDIYKTKRANAPVMIFIHGGSWRSGRSADFAVYAEPFVKAGVDRLPKIAQPATTAANTNGRSRHDHSFTRQMFREWLARRTPAGERRHRRGLRHRLLGGDLVLGG